jgi:tetratricopeptide (TPR) repeat protein
VAAPRQRRRRNLHKPGRNEPCHCGSGKKYKKCCQPKEEAAEREVIAKDQAVRAERAEAHRLQQRAAKAESLARIANAGKVDEELEELTAASNAAVALVKAGKLEEAEAAARHLLERFPHVHDGWHRLGMVHEARGAKKPAADCYRKAIEIIRTQPEHYDPEFADVFVELVDKLDPPAPAANS